MNVLYFHFLSLGLFLFLGVVYLLIISLLCCFMMELIKFLLGIVLIQIAVLVQFNGRLLISVVGSKIENKFLITFSLFC